MSVEPPGYDPLTRGRETREVSVRGYHELVHAVMRMENLTHPEAERYLEDKGREEAERRIRASNDYGCYGGGDA